MRLDYFCETFRTAEPMTKLVVTRFILREPSSSYVLTGQVSDGFEYPIVEPRDADRV